MSAEGVGQAPTAGTAGQVHKRAVPLDNNIVQGHCLLRSHKP